MDDIRPTRYPAGSVIFKEGDAADGVYLIEIGSVDIVKRQGDSLVLLSRMGEKQIFGEMAVIDGKPRSATAIAREETLCYIISHEHFSKKLHDLEPFMYGMFRIFITTIRRLNDQVRNPSYPLAGEEIIPEPIRADGEADPKAQRG